MLKEFLLTLSLKQNVGNSDSKSSQILEHEINFDKKEELVKDTTGTDEDSTDKVEHNINDIPHNYILVDTADKRKDLIDKLENQKSFCFDTETTGLDANNSELVAIAFFIQTLKKLIL